MNAPHCYVTSRNILIVANFILTTPTTPPLVQILKLGAGGCKKITWLLEKDTNLATRRYFPGTTYTTVRTVQIIDSITLKSSGYYA